MKQRTLVAVLAGLCLLIIGVVLGVLSAGHVKEDSWLGRLGIVQRRPMTDRERFTNQYQRLWDRLPLTSELKRGHDFGNNRLELDDNGMVIIATRMTYCEKVLVLRANEAGIQMADYERRWSVKLVNDHLRLPVWKTGWTEVDLNKLAWIPADKPAIEQLFNLGEEAFDLEGKMPIRDRMAVQKRPTIQLIVAPGFSGFGEAPLQEFARDHYRPQIECSVFEPLPLVIYTMPEHRDDYDYRLANDDLTRSCRANFEAHDPQLFLGFTKQPFFKLDLRNYEWTFILPR